MVLKTVKKYWIAAVCALLLLGYFYFVCVINFSGNPFFYSTDMYTDMVYAQECWEHKSIFPDGWVFGNQLYTVATPVVAALFYGMTGDYCVAMGIAATVMGIGVLLSFGYLLRAVYGSLWQPLLGMVVFVALVLVSGDPVHATAGWQLFFTMCSFYSCYAIAAFLAFGCYLRAERSPSVPFKAMFAFACLLAFGTGVQSLRQTAVMVLPLMAVELFRMACRFVKKEKVLTEGSFAAGLLVAANFAGVLFAGIANIPQVEIFGKIRFAGVSQGFGAWKACLSDAVSLFGTATEQSMESLAGIVLFLLIFVVYKLRSDKKPRGIACLFLLLFGVGAILLVDMFTTMYIRNIYYFLLYPLVAFFVVFLCAHTGKLVRVLVVILLVINAFSQYRETLAPVTQQAQSRPAYEETVAYLEEQGITTVFSGWNRSEGVAIASKGSIRAAFWDSYRKPFIRVNYLCDPSVFDVEPQRCAYLFFYASEADVAIAKARERGVELTLLRYIASEGVYIYTADVNLMTNQ